MLRDEVSRLQDQIANLKQALRALEDKDAILRSKIPVLIEAAKQTEFHKLMRDFYARQVYEQVGREIDGERQDLLRLQKENAALKEKLDKESREKRWIQEVLIPKIKRSSEQKG